jgi:predicted nucleic acid-binding protein
VKFLVDANVLSEATKPAPDERCIAWLRTYEQDLVVDPVILGEIRFGILLLPNGKRRARLEHWFATGVERLQCLSWDVATGLRWAELLAALRRSGRAMPIKDSLIAATALVHGLTIATRNQVDFQPAGVPSLIPFSSLASLRLAEAASTAARLPSSDISAGRTDDPGSPAGSQTR